MTTPGPDELDAAALEPRRRPDDLDLLLRSLERTTRRAATDRRVDPVLAIAVAAYLRAAGSCGPCSFDVAAAAATRHAGDELAPTWAWSTLAHYVRQLDDRGRCGHRS